jgi:hypothetical protein
MCTIAVQLDQIVARVECTLLVKSLHRYAVFDVRWHWFVTNALLHTLLIGNDGIVYAVYWQTLVPQMQAELSFPIEILANVHKLRLIRGEIVRELTRDKREQLESVRIYVLVRLEINIKVK